MDATRDRVVRDDVATPHHVSAEVMAVRVPVDIGELQRAAAGYQQAGNDAPALLDLLPVLVRFRRQSGQPLSERERGVLRALASEVEELAYLDERHRAAEPGTCPENVATRPDARPRVGRSAGGGAGGQGPGWSSGRGSGPGGQQPDPPAGRDIRSLRLALGWSQEVLAERAGFEVSTVKRAERGVHVPERTLRVLAAAMGVEPTAAAKTAARYWRHLGRAHEALGGWSEARHAYERAATTSRAEGDLVGETLAELQLARLDLRAGRTGGLAGRLVRCRQVLENLGEASACWQVDRLLAETNVVLGRPEIAIPHLHRLLDAPGISVEDRIEVLDALARAYTAAGQGGRADAAARDAAALRVGGAREASERVRRYAEQAARLHNDGRQAQAAYLAEVAAQWAMFMRALDGAGPPGRSA